MGEREYVRRRKRDEPGDHTCHWPGCGKTCPAAMWGCCRCWMKLPKPLRDRLWAAFRPGQEEDKSPSREYVAAAREIQQWIRDNHPPDDPDDTLM